EAVFWSRPSGMVRGRALLATGLRASSGSRVRAATVLPGSLLDRQKEKSARCTPTDARRPKKTKGPTDSRDTLLGGVLSEEGTLRKSACEKRCPVSAMPNRKGPVSYPY